ncbi:amino acid ABC transporter substrate-binding protein [Magnetofaba australis]|nr:amino acid ABC transporter substrate-binding protein [Magnetofaba australis]
MGAEHSNREAATGIGRALARLLTALALLVSLFAAPSAQADANPITIGVTLGLSGKFAPMAAMSANGYRLWEAHVNAQGGLLGRPVKLIIYDDHSDKQRAIALYEKLINADRVDLLFGPYSSSVTAAVAPLAERHGYPMLAAGAAADTLWRQGYKHLFGLFIPASRYAVGFLEMIALNGIQHIALVGADDPFSQSILDGARDWGRKFGLHVTIEESFHKGEHHLTPLAERLAKAAPEAVIMCGHFDEAVDLRRALAAVKFSPRAYFATVGPAMESFRERLGAKLAEGVFSSSQWEVGARYTPNDEEIFLHPFIERFGVTPSYQAADAFAAAQILAYAIRKTGSIERPALRDQLAKMNAVSIIGHYGVDRNGMQIKHFSLTTQWIQGRKQIVWPEQLASAPPQFDSLSPLQ